MKLALLLGLLFCISPTQSVEKTIKQKEKPTTINCNITSKVSSIIYSTRTRKDQKYALRIALAILKSAREYKVPLEVIITTGYIESEFSMYSRPCIGIMQVNISTYKEMDKSTGLNPKKLEDNIRLGTRELSRYYYHPLASRYGGNWRLRYTWGRYNGAGPHSKYVHKALRIYKKIKSSLEETSIRK